MNGDLQAFIENRLRKKDTNLGPNYDNWKIGEFHHGCVPKISMKLPGNMKKNGGRPRPHSQKQLFRDMVDECAFMDLGFVGFPFTWHKNFVGYTI